jgi:hypothetical protein
MKRLLVPLATIPLILFPGGSVLAGGVKSEDDMTWRVAYRENEASPQTGDHALRLKVRRPNDSAPRITGELWRYVHQPAMNGNPAKYKRRAGQAGNITMTGVITEEGQDGTRKLERFVLSGLYVQGGELRQIIIRGYHTVGKNKNNRGDDQLCVRIRDRRIGAGGALERGLGAPGDPCDEQPPDEDILTEDDDPDNEEEEDYDGG